MRAAPPKMVDPKKNVLVIGANAREEARIAEALAERNGYHIQHLDWNRHTLTELASSKERKCLIVWYDYLLRLKESDPALLFRLTRSLVIILALTRTRLLEAGSVLSFVDGCLFVDDYLALAPDILKLGERGYTILPAYIEPTFGAEKIRLELLHKLTALERKTLLLLGGGATNRSISRALSVSETHTKSLVRSVLHKLQFQNRTEAGVFAARHHLGEQNVF